MTESAVVSENSVRRIRDCRESEHDRQLIRNCLPIRPLFVRVLCDCLKRPGILEPILGDGDSMGAAAPFADERRTGFKVEARRCANPTSRPQGGCPVFELCEAVAAKIYVKRRWLGEQGRRVSFCFGVLPERRVTPEVACAPSVVGSLWPLPA